MKTFFTFLNLIFISFFNMNTWAQTSVDNKTYLKAPEPPKYEACQSVPNPNSNDGSKIIDPACQSRNSATERSYNAAVESFNRASRIVSSNASTLTKPVEPQYEICTTNTNGQQDYSCLSRNQQKQKDYSIQSAAWNQFQQSQAQEIQNLSQQELQAKSASEALQKAIEQNKKASQKSNSAAQHFMILSGALGLAYVGSCAGTFGAGCQPKLLAASVAMGIISAVSSRQAGKNDFSAQGACEAEAKLSGKPVDCSALQNMSQPETPASALSKTFDQSGNCIAKDPTVCKTVTDNLPPGVKLPDLLKDKNSGFAGTTVPKIDKDGKITITKNGKTYQASDFASVEAMKAAGFTDDQAKQAFATINKAMMPGSNPLADLNKDLKSNKDIDFGGFAISGSGSAEQAKSNSEDSAGQLNSQGIDGHGKNPRKPSSQSEGLTRSFNGENIGASGDDIFSMMNRRYIMKANQDSFISK